MVKLKDRLEAGALSDAASFHVFSGVPSAVSPVTVSLLSSGNFRAESRPDVSLFFFRESLSCVVWVPVFPPVIVTVASLVMYVNVLENAEVWWSRPCLFCDVHH